MNEQKPYSEYVPFSNNKYTLYIATIISIGLIGLSCSFNAYYIGDRLIDNYNHNMMLSDEEYDICVTKPIFIDSPMGQIQLGIEGEQDMRDPIKAYIVRALDQSNITQVQCK